MLTEAEYKNAARQARNKYMREWRRKNPERVIEINTKYWARKAQQSIAGGVEECQKEELT